MLKRYRFHYDIPPDQALAKLDTGAANQTGFGLKVEPNGTVKLFRDQGMVLLNGFLPVFVGRFTASDAGSDLRGGFRFHLFAIALFAAFVTVSVAGLVSVVTSPDTIAGMPADWKWQRIRFELQFIGFAILAAGFSWLAGKPMRESMLAIIERSTR